ncbi:MAG: sulfatase-like hydrolase/transferase [Bryobacter sp.]|jgi:arylsulfatase A|nr:sulfatase-like hydrolase/transferase [Bryobacter sp.]
MVDRRQFLSALAAPLAAPPRPNIVIVLCDDLGYGDLSCFGHAKIRTPRLDRFASEGVKFTDCYSAAPVCSPSRAGMLTGRVPNRLGVYDWIPQGSPMHLKREETTFAKILQQAGYATAHIGKWHCNGKFNSPDQPQPGDHGFSYWFSTQNNAGPSHRNPVNFVRNGVRVGPLEGYSSQIIADESIRWLQQVRQPYCLFACFHSPHEPISTHPEFTDMYQTATQDTTQREYFGNVTQMDHEFGRILDALPDPQNTFVLFTSDNGPETLHRYKGSERSHGSPGPLRGMKLHLYEAGYRVPGIARMPGLTKAGAVSSEPFCGLDVLPTVCALTGTKPGPKPLDGSDARAALRGERVRRARPLHWHYLQALGRVKSTLRDGDWKICGKSAAFGERTQLPNFNPVEGPRQAKALALDDFELYNLRRDPGEKKDLAAAEPARRKRLQEQLIASHEDVKREAPLWD